MRKDIFTKDAPFQTVEEFTNWWAEKTGNEDLSLDGLEADDDWYRNREISLDRIKNKAIDIISVVDSEINEDWWENTLDADQFLVGGTVREINLETTLYLQGYGWKEK
jgi:hypothetical protein